MLLYSIRPRRKAAMAALARLDTPSVLMMSVTCLLMVRIDRWRRWAISLFEWPRATNRNTSS